MKNGFRGSRRIDDRHRVGTLIRGATALCALFVVAAGCASFNQKCSYFEDGTLKDYRLRSTVIGTGETEAVSTDCAVSGYSTRDTGLSDNGREALEDITEAAVRGAIGAALPLP